MGAVAVVVAVVVAEVVGVAVGEVAAVVVVGEELDVLVMVDDEDTG